jgi:hypothetical protein
MLTSRSMIAPSRRRSRSSGEPLSPHIRRWSPRIQRSPGCVTGSSGGSGVESGSVSPCGDALAGQQLAELVHVEGKQRPVDATPWSSASRSGSSSMSQVASSPVLLSAMRYARACSGVRSMATWTGTLASPSFCAALNRVCPQMMTPASSTTMGWRKPNSARLDAATASTAWSFWRGFFSYGADVVDLPQLDGEFRRGRTLRSSHESTSVCPGFARRGNRRVANKLCHVSRRVRVPSMAARAGKYLCRFGTNKRRADGILHAILHTPLARTRGRILTLRAGGCEGFIYRGRESVFFLINKPFSLLQILHAGP